MPVSLAAHIETEHLLLGIMREDKRIFRQRAGLTLEAVCQELESQTLRRETISPSVDLPLSAESKRALVYAAEEADALGHRNIDTCHLLLGLLRIENSIAAGFLRKHGIDYTGYRESVRIPPAATPADEPVAIQVKALAPALVPSIATLQRLVTLSTEPLRAYSEYQGRKRLKRKTMSRKQALGHLVNLAIAHHLWVARALNEPTVVAGMYPLEAWVAAQQYESFEWTELAELWISLNRLLIHVLCGLSAGEDRHRRSHRHRRATHSAVVDRTVRCGI
jgi:ClpA/ClpB-like protein